MTNLAETNSIALIIALLIGVAVGWWIFKRIRGAGGKVSGAEPIEREAPRKVEKEHPVSRRTDGREGNSLVDQGAAATTDVAGHVLGVQVHAELPGAAGPPDNLEVMKGVGPKFVAKLHENGIIRFDQLARLSSNEIAILDDKMGPFKGRLERDRDGFEARFGKLGGA